MKFIQDINDIYHDKDLVSTIDYPGASKIYVSAVNEQGFIKKCEATVLPLLRHSPIKIGSNYFKDEKSYSILKVDFFSEHKFIPLIKDIEVTNLTLSKKLNPAYYFQAVEVLTNNISNAPFLDESYFRLNSYILVLESTL